MHQPRPYGCFVRGDELSGEDAAEVARLTKLLTNYKQVSELDSLRWGRSLPSGRLAVVQDMGGILKVMVREAAHEEHEEARFDALYVPMLFSGVITHARLRGDEGVGIRLSEGTRRRIERFVPRDWAAGSMAGATGWQVPQQVSLQRFRIRYHAMVSEFEPLMATAVLHTQYAQQRPTWYSGAMAEVMQIVGGYGRQDVRSLPDDPVERVRMRIPEKYRARIAQQLEGFRQPWCRGVPPVSGQFQFDYKHRRTDGVGFDTSGKPWMLRVSHQGVFAMPLPVVPATTTAAFREWVEEVGDEELLAILDRFGAMPSGEAMPASVEDFQAWRRAGAIIKICDTADFYTHSAYATSCGWSFNLSGREGYNTCFDYDERGLGYGLGYKLSLSLEPVRPPAGREPPSDPVQAAALRHYLAGLMQQLRAASLPASRRAAVDFKLARATTQQLLARAGAAVGPAEVAFWDNFEAPAIAGHSGSVTQVARGPLYHPAKPEFQPQIKFPEPSLGGCVSHDFSPQVEGVSADKCDTVMFGYYVGDQLKVIKYFYDGRGFEREVQSDFEPCMTVGSWTQVVSSGQARITGNFYTSDIDDRQTLTPRETTTRIVGRDLGYDSVPRFDFDALYWRTGTLSRKRYFSRRTTVHVTEGHERDIGLCIPYLCRNALLHAQVARTSGEGETDAVELMAVADPTVYRFWTQDAVMHWIGSLPLMSGRPWPKDANPVWVEMEFHEPYPCSDFADQGSWIPGLPHDIAWLVHPKAGEWKLSGGGGAPSLKAYFVQSGEAGSETGRLMLSALPAAEQVHARVPDARYFTISPDPYLGVFSRDVAMNRFGKAIYVSASEKDAEGRFWRRGFTRLADHKSAHHFIGVIHE